MTLFIILYLIALSVAAAVVVVHVPDHYKQVGYLLVGALLAILPSFLMDLYRRARDRKNVTVALFHELGKNVGRCCYDFENPWGAWLSKPQSIGVERARKFIPDPPVIYPALAPKIALLENDEAQAIIDFYAALAAWRKDASDVVEASGSLDNKRVQFLAERLRRTLRPGQRALQALAKHVPEADKIEINALRDSDEMFPDAHPHKGKTVRARIEIALRETANSKE